MININKFDYPNNLKKIFDKLNKNGIKPIIVGGYIRDFFLNLKSKDIDIELYGLLSINKLEKILEEFGSVNSVGKSFGVCKLRLKEFEIDFTLPRVDSKVSSGHKGFEITIDKDLDFKTATSRRDFTINAIGYDTQNRIILDPFNGLDDLKNKILRAVDLEKFEEDPLRILRAAAFHSRLNFTVEDSLFLLCKKMCNQNALNTLSSQRIFIEIKKILLKSTKPSIGFIFLKRVDALKYFSLLEKLSDDDFKTVLSKLDEASKLKTNSDKTNITIMLATLCYKFDTNQATKFISSLTNEKELLFNILSLIKNKFKTDYSDSQLFRLAVDVNIEHFLLLNRAIHTEVEDYIFDDIKNRAIKLGILNKKAVAFLQGRDILAYGLKPSKEYSKILRSAYEAQINLEITSYSEAKEWLKDYLSKTFIFNL